MKGQIFRMAHLGYFDFADMFGIIAGLEMILRPTATRWNWQGRGCGAARL